MFRVAAVAVVGVLALPGFAAADSSSVTYRADLAPVDPAASGPSGEVRLLDAKSYDVVTVRVEDLQPDTRYAWHVHQFAADVTDPCTPDARQGQIVSAFRYGALTTNSHGKATATAASTEFEWGDRRYYVNVHDPQTLLPIACGILSS